MNKQFFKTTTNNSMPAPTKKDHKKLYIFLTVLALIIILTMVAFSRLGFMPGISSSFGTNKTKNLGVQYTPSDLTSYQQKTAITMKDAASAPVNPNNPNEKIIFTDPKTVKGLNLTEQELTAAVNSTTWQAIPMTNAQVRLSDGTVELSGNLNVDSINKQLTTTGGSGNNQSYVTKFLNLSKFAGDNVPIYIKASASVQNNRLKLVIVEAQVWQVNVPLVIANSKLSSELSNVVLRNEQFEISSAKAVDGALFISGTYPTTIYAN